MMSFIFCRLFVFFLINWIKPPGRFMQLCTKVLGDLYFNWLIFNLDTFCVQLTAW